MRPWRFKKADDETLYRRMREGFIKGYTTPGVTPAQAEAAWLQSQSSNEATRDYAAEVGALGRSEPENPVLYNAIRRGLDDWFASTSEAYASRLKHGAMVPNHDDGDPWCDGLARYIVTRIRWAAPSTTQDKPGVVG